MGLKVGIWVFEGVFALEIRGFSSCMYDIVQLSKFISSNDGKQGFRSIPFEYSYFSLQNIKQ